MMNQSCQCDECQVNRRQEPDDTQSSEDSTLARIAELERENAELKKIANLVRMKLTSGNGIPVERCTIRASEISALASEKENERG